MCEIIINGETVKFEGSVLTEKALKPYQETAREIRICNSVTEIEGYAFFKFKNLKNIEIPNSVKEIQKFTFCGCEAIEHMIIPNKITKIGDDAFNSCKSLKSVVIPKSVIYIGSMAFHCCNDVRIKIESSKDILTPDVLWGREGQIITVDIAGSEYSVLTVYNNINDIIEENKEMVITGFVDYDGGKLYSGYEFNGDLDPQYKKLLYCCYRKDYYLFYDATMDGLKRQLEKVGIR